MNSDKVHFLLVTFSIWMVAGVITDLAINCIIGLHYGIGSIVTQLILGLIWTYWVYYFKYVSK